MYVFLPGWPIDRLRRPNKSWTGEKRTGSTPSLGSGAPAEEPPFATVVATGGRHLLAAINPAAAAVGLAPGMPLADALSFLPGLATVLADPAADSLALTRLAEWCGRYSPWAAPDGADGVKIEITGSAHLWGGEAALVADLARRLARQKIAHRIAIAGTLGTAWALARYAASDGQPALPAPQDERAALAHLPVEALRLDPLTVQGLRRVGLRQIGELYPMPRDALARRFGANGLNGVAHRLDQAFGDLPEPLSPLGETPSRRVRLSFAEPISDPADLARATQRLVEDLTARLAREGMGARRLDLGFHRIDGRVEHIPIGTARPSRDPRHLAGLFAAKFDTVDPGLGIEDMILAVFAVEPLPAEQVEFAGAGPKTAAPDIASLLDRLGNRLGLDAISRIEPRASHIPERASINVSLERQTGAISTPSPPLGASPKNRHSRRAQEAAPPPPRGGGGDPGLDPGKPEGAELAAGPMPRRNSSDSSCVLSDSHTPSTMLRMVPLPRSAEEDQQIAAGRASSLPRKRGRVEVGADIASRKPPRPIRLFQPPEPVEAQWVLPDDPPFRFTWRRRQHRVMQADGPERIAEEWWVEGGPVNARIGAADAIRDYYRVEDIEGRRFWLFRAGLPGDPPPRWFVHGIFA
jgi:protein ImuB